MNRAQLIAAMEAILAAAEAETRDLTADETVKFDGLKAELDAIDHAAEASANIAARRAEVLARRTAPAAAVAATPAATPVAAGRTVPMRGAEQPKEFETLAEFCGAAICNPNDARLAALFRSRREFRDDGDVRAEQRMDTGQSGGFMIPTQFRATIMAVAGPQSIVRSRATVIPAGTPADAEIDIPALDQTGTSPNNVYGGVSVSWIAEGGAKPETDADFRLVSLKPQEVAGHIVMTDKLLRNSAAAGAYVASQLPRALAYAEDAAFISGNGIGKPQGFIGSGAAYAQARTTASTVKYADLVEMLARLLMLGGSPVWIINRALLPVIAQIQDNSGGAGQGAYVFTQGNMQSAIPDSLFGYPVIWSERSPAVGARGDVALVDLTGYLIKDGSGPFIAYSEHVYFLSNKTVVKAFTNVDGKPWLTEPFEGQDGRTSSPFVVLAA